VLLIVMLVATDCWETYVGPDGVEYVRWICETEEDREVAIDARRAEFECCLQYDILNTQLRFELASCKAAKEVPFAFQSCMTGPLPEALYLHTRFIGCRSYDIDNDGDIDLFDWSSQ
jgi:hypothetical protein